MAQRKAKRVELVYGRSGVGKTTWWLKLAKYLYDSQGITTRCYHGMGGSETILGSGLVEAGIVQLADYTIRDNPLETSRFCCQGFWPADVEDPTSPWVALEKSDPQGSVGMFVIEGLTAMSNYIMGHKTGGLADLASKGQKIGQDSPILIKNGTMTFGGNPPAHFGQTQRLILDFIEETRRLPGWVYWTAHQREAEDRETQEKLVGPDVAGKALTAKIGGSFGNTIHLDTASKKVKSTDPTTGKSVDQLSLERRAYFVEHYDPDGVSFTKYFANNRVFDSSTLPKSGYLTPPDPVAFYKLALAAQHAAERKAVTTTT